MRKVVMLLMAGLLAWGCAKERGTRMTVELVGTGDYVPVVEVGRGMYEMVPEGEGRMGVT